MWKCEEMAAKLSLLPKTIISADNFLYFLAKLNNIEPFEIHFEKRLF